MFVMNSISDVPLRNTVYAEFSMNMYVAFQFAQVVGLEFSPCVPSCRQMSIEVENSTSGYEMQ